MKRFIALVVVLVVTTLGLAAFTETYAGPDGSSFSHSELWGIPLLALRTGDASASTPAFISIGLPGLGVICVGVGGVGIVSIGALGIGILFGVGQLATGIFSVGQLSVGGLLGVGQLACGWAALGQLALGIRARGQGYTWRDGNVFFRSLSAELEEALRFDALERRLKIRS